MSTGVSRKQAISRQQDAANRQAAANRQIRIFTTGGTFDKEYNELQGELFFKGTHVPEMLELGRSSLSVEIESLMEVDSLTLENADRVEIAKHCVAAQESAILITHGTDTMVETALVIKHMIEEQGEHAKTIVLTGAMVPYKFGSSDGLFNLGSALSFVQVLDPGVYIAMNGVYFPADCVRKNRAVGRFERTDMDVPNLEAL